MPTPLFHRPEGDHNPYDVPLWGRHPLRPTTDDPVRVGVRADVNIGPVRLEIAQAEITHHELTLEGDTWWTTIAPLADSGKYRFASDTGESTEWFPLDVDRWLVDEFVEVRRVGATIQVATALGHMLRLRGDGARVAWSFDADGAEGDFGQGSDLNVRLEGGDSVVDVGGRSIALAAPRWRVSSDEKVRAVTLGWRLSAEEALFGGGERYDRLNQRGRTPDIRVYEEYKGQDARTYFPLPWIMSDGGYAISIESRDRVQFDLGANSADLGEAVIPIDQDPARGQFLFGEPAQLVQSYAQRVGLPTTLPTWAYGPWMSGNEWNTDDRVRAEVTRTLDEETPASVIVIEAWSDEATFYLFNDSTYDVVGGAEPVRYEDMTFGEMWPDPRGLVDWLHERGVRVLLWQIPILKDFGAHAQHAADVAYARDEELVVQIGDGEAYPNRGWWFSGGNVIDFTNSESREWWFAKRAWLLDELGVDGFKTDGGEHLWGEDVVTAADERGHVAANMYPTHYLAAYHSFLTSHDHDQPMLFSRAGFTGAQAFPAHWAGDEDSTWAAYRASLTAGLSAGLSGIGYWSWDIAGFSGPIPSSELFQRGTAMGAFSPIMQYHSEHNEHRVPSVDRTPWNIAEQTDDPAVHSTYRWFARARMNLVPYLEAVGLETAGTGMPMLRAMLLHFPHDPVAVGIDDQYLLGPDLIVAPVLEEGATSRRVYIPEGSWWSLWNGVSYQPGWHEVSAAVDEIPVFVRGGVAIPLWLGEDGSIGSPVDLPGEGRGHSVSMVFPGNAANELVKPSSAGVTRIQVREGQMTVAGHAESPDVLWLRGGADGDAAHDVSGDFVETLAL